jgi:HSP20 family protein
MYTMTRTRNGLAPLARLFEDVVGDLSWGAQTWVPALDLVETPDAYLVRVDVPGVDPSDVEIAFEEGRLAIRGEKKTEDQVEGRGYHRVERRTGRFERVLHVGDGVDTDKLSAESRNGVLTITLPKRAEKKPRTIQVKVY